MLAQHAARDRRLFLKAGAALAVSAATTKASSAAQPNRPELPPLSIGVMGVNGRGNALARGFANLENCSVDWLCDVDSRALPRCTNALTKAGHKAPKTTADYRDLLDDDALDAIVVATPNHWHAPATIAGCAAGKHVYVEKPCSHNAQEGEWSIAAAEKHQRIVQMGTQRRSWPAIREAVQRLNDGVIGDVLYARTWYNNRRGAIGKGKIAPPPEWLRWDLWQGPAPRHDYRDNLVHYNWHWHWDYGNGELGNNGIHALDVARWGVGVTFPTRVTAGGGKYRHDDSQETPDTMMVTFDFPEQRSITWEGLSWSTLGPHDSRFGISFHGTEGALVIRDASYVRFDNQAKVVEEQSGSGGDPAHLSDFVSAIAEQRPSNANIVEAHRSTLLCHLGNIAYRTDSVLQVDPKTGHIRDNSAAKALWGRTYEPGWEPTF